MFRMQAPKFCLNKKDGTVEERSDEKKNEENRVKETLRDKHSKATAPNRSRWKRFTCSFIQKQKGRPEKSKLVVVRSSRGR